MKVGKEEKMKKKKKKRRALRVFFKVFLILLRTFSRLIIFREAVN